MSGMLKYILAMVTPWGRLPQFSYGVLALLTLAAHFAISLYVSANIEELPAYNLYAMSELALLWVMFSLMSRRFHDSGDPAVFLFPLLICTIAAYLVALDHAKLMVSVFEEDRESAQMYGLLKAMFQACGLALALFAMKNSGDSHANAYGPEFSATTSARKSRIAEAIKPPEPAWKRAAQSQPASKPAPPRKPGFGADVRTSNSQGFRRRSTDR